MLPDRVSNPGPLTYESGALPIAPCGPAKLYHRRNYITRECNGSIGALGTVTCLGFFLSSVL